jgi:hypothetical protein
MEVRSTRPPANRAVAALQSASGTVASASPLLSVPPPSRRATAPLIRYTSFDALCQAQQKTDENAALREELSRKLPQPTPRNDVAALGDQVTVRILELLDPNSADAAAFGETCRAVREHLLHVRDVERAVVVPAMVSCAAALAAESVQNSLRAFFTARGSEVRSLLVRKIGASTAKETPGESLASPSSPLLRLPGRWVLQLVSQMPYLTTLDLRHVQWTESRGSQVLPYFFSDLHIATTGTLCTLKFDAALMPYWTPGWWRRHVNLRTLTVGSRYYFACSSSNGSNATSFSATSVLELPPDYYTLMREEGRVWELELWCPLKPNSLQQLFSPAATVPFAGVAELLVNMRGNERVCESAAHVGAAAGGGGAASSAMTGSTGAAAVAGGAEASADAKPNAKGRKTPAAADAVELVITYPQLRTVTVVDVGDRPEGAAEAYQVMLSLAPELKRFNVCDTVVIGSPAVAEGGKNERIRRGGGDAASAAAKHVH